MITLDQYFGRWINHPDATPERKANAQKLLDACAALEFIAKDLGVKFYDNPATECCQSGDEYGGFRPQSCPIGAPHSAHKEGLAVDLFDPRNEIDAWCMANTAALRGCGICIEHPDTTPNWSHWTIRVPVSGHTVFYP